MDDYKGLSTRLLNAAQSYEAYQLGGEFADVLTDAARAIDDLTAALAASNEVIAKSKLRWIPVTERLPEAHKNVLCCGSKGGMFVGWVASKTYDGGDKATAFVGGGQGRNITHWMELPEPPEIGALQ